MEFASEMVVKSRLKDFEISEVPTVLSPDGRSRPPHLKTWRDGWRHLRFLLLHSPRWLFLYPGLALLGLGLLGILALLTGPLHLTPSVELDFNTLLISDFSVLVGAQFVSFAILARRFAAAEGVLPPIYTAPTFIESLTLERWLQIGLMALIIGVGGVAWSVWHWAKQDFGPIYFTGVMRYLSFSLTLIALAFQLGASAFLASVFDLRCRDAP